MRHRAAPTGPMAGAAAAPTSAFDRRTAARPCLAAPIVNPA